MEDAFKKFLSKIGAQESIQEYTGIAIKGFTIATIYYQNIARAYFNKGNYLMADHYIQRANALRLPHASKTDDIFCLFNKLSSEQIYKEARKKCLESRKEHFVDGSRDGLLAEHDQWTTDLNKIQLAKCVADILADFKQPTCLELGSHGGSLLHLIKEYCSVKPTLIGIEPQPEAINICKEKYPDIAVTLGNHNDLKRFNDMSISVLLLSCVLLLMEPEEVEVVLEFAKNNCEYVVIMDDVGNFKGKIPIPRRYYLLHPYKTLFDKYGFSVVKKYFPPEPNWAISGILVAKNNG